DPRLLEAAVFVALEEGGQTLEDGVLPSGEQGRAEQVFAAQLRRRALSGDQLQDHLGLEARGKVPPLTSWHMLLLQGPVFLSYWSHWRGAAQSLYSPYHFLLSSWMRVPSSLSGASTVLPLRSLIRAKRWPLRLMISASG